MITSEAERGRGGNSIIEGKKLGGGGGGVGSLITSRLKKSCPSQTPASREPMGAVQRVRKSGHYCSRREKVTR